MELLESAAIEGFDAAILQLLEIYSCDARFKNTTKAQEMFKRAEELEIDDVEFSEAVEGYAAELGVVSKRIKDSEVNELEKNVDDNYEEMTARARETRGSADGWMFPNGHDDGESPDTGAFGG